MKSKVKLIIALFVVTVIVLGAFFAYKHFNKNNDLELQKAIFSEQAYDADLSLIKDENDFTLQLSLGNIKVFHIDYINLDLETKQLKLIANYIQESNEASIKDFGLWDNLFDEEKERIMAVYGSKENFINRKQYFNLSLAEDKEFNTNTSYSALSIIVVPNLSFYESEFFNKIDEKYILENKVCVVGKDSVPQLEENGLYSHACIQQEPKQEQEIEEEVLTEQSVVENKEEENKANS